MAVTVDPWRADARLATEGQTAVVDTSAGSDWSGLLRDAVNVYGAVQQGRLYEDLSRLNLDRARQGLPPIDVGAYQQGLSVGVDPATRQLITVAIFGILGLGALWLLTRKR